MVTKETIRAWLEAKIKFMQEIDPDGHAPSRLQFVGMVFDITTYDSGMGEHFGAMILRVLNAIVARKTFEFQEDREQYIEFLTVVNFSGIAPLLEWGTSIRGAWISLPLGGWCADGKIGGYVDDKSLVLKTQEEFKDFVEVLSEGVITEVTQRTPESGTELIKQLLTGAGQTIVTSEALKQMPETERKSLMGVLVAELNQRLTVAFTNARCESDEQVVTIVNTTLDGVNAERGIQQLPLLTYHLEANSADGRGGVKRTTWSLYLEAFGIPAVITLS